MNNRRGFVLGALVLLIGPFAVEAQQTAKPARVGFLTASSLGRADQIIQ